MTQVLIILPIWLLSLLPIAMLKGYVASTLWAWFIVPWGIRQMSIYEAVGAMLVIGILWPITMKPGTDKDKLSAEDFLSNMLVYSLFFPLLLLGIGAVWRWLQWGVA